jgi:hypothetical protein
MKICPDCKDDGVNPAGASLGASSPDPVRVDHTAQVHDAVRRGEAESFSGRLFDRRRAIPAGNFTLASMR